MILVGKHQKSEQITTMHAAKIVWRRLCNNWKSFPFQIFVLE